MRIRKLEWTGLWKTDWQKRKKPPDYSLLKRISKGLTIIIFTVIDVGMIFNNYDLTLDSGTFSVEQAVDIIMAALKKFD